MRSPGWNISPGICSDFGMNASARSTCTMSAGALLANDGAGDDLALPLRELLDERVALVLAELLDHHLLGGLRGNAAETLDRDDLAPAVGKVPPDRECAAQAVHLATELLRVERIEVLACSAHHRHLKVADDLLAVDVAIASDGVEETEGFGSHESCPLRSPGCALVELSPRPARQLGCRDGLVHQTRLKQTLT